MAKLSREEMDKLMYGDDDAPNETQKATQEEEILEQNDEFDEVDEANEEVDDGESEEQELQTFDYDKPLDEMTQEEKEAFAQRQGWNPNFKGDKALTADDYLRKSETEMPVLRDTVKRMAEKMDAMESGLTRQRELIEKSLRREYEEKLNEIKAQKAKLEEEGLYERADFDKYSQLSDQEKHYTKELEEKPDEQEGITAEQIKEADKVINNFVTTKAQWYNENPYLRSVADSLIPTINQMYPNESLERKLELVDKMVRENNPHLFANEKRSKPSKIQPNSRASSSANKPVVKKNFSFNQLSATDKKEFSVFKSLNFGMKQGAGESKDDFSKRVKAEEQKLLNEYGENYKQS